MTADTPTPNVAEQIARDKHAIEHHYGPFGECTHGDCHPPWTAKEIRAEIRPTS